jgi:integrase
MKDTDHSIRHLQVHPGERANVYSTLLRSLQVDLKVQQELLRHSDIRTTMNIYTQAVPEAMREANSRVVEMVLPKREVG